MYVICLIHHFFAGHSLLPCPCAVGNSLVAMLHYRSNEGVSQSVKSCAGVMYFFLGYFRSKSEFVGLLIF